MQIQEMLKEQQLLPGTMSLITADYAELFGADYNATAYVVIPHCGSTAVRANYGLNGGKILVTENCLLYAFEGEIAIRIRDIMDGDFQRNRIPMRQLFDSVLPGSIVLFRGRSLIESDTIKFGEKSAFSFYIVTAPFKPDGRT